MTDESDEDRMRRLSKDRYERPLPKRFYKTVEVTPDHQVLLDGRAIKTPMKAPLQLPNGALAEAVADEWRAQVDVINPGIMPMTRLANAAIDRAEQQREALIAEIVQYANADLVCYRADRPPDLVALQSKHWDGPIAWARSRLNAAFITTHGITHVDQPDTSLGAVRNMVGKQDAMGLTVSYNLITLLGSALIPLQLLDGAMTAEQAWSAAHVDEDYQISQWGSDEKAAARRSYRRQEFDAFVRFANCL
jgi:chaperone required for assembly of F1-ATPase